MSVIEIRKLNFGYDYKRKIISDLDITFGNGVIALCGPNGSGKTTLLKVISGIIENYEGVINIYGRDIKSLKRKELAKTLSFVSSDIYTPFDFKVIDVLLMGRISYIDFFSYYSEDDYFAVLNVAKHTGITHLLNRSFLEISSGEKELVLLSQSFVQDCPIILMDEPFLHLDLKHKLNLLKIFRDYILKKNGCGITVLHDLRIVEKFADIVAFIKDGKIVEKIKASSIKEKIALISEIYEVKEKDIKDFLF